jgi:hypothetical protein
MDPYQTWAVREWWENAQRLPCKDRHELEDVMKARLERAREIGALRAGR